MTQGDSDLLLFSCSGKSIRFAESDVRVMGRSARGVKGIALKSDQRLISMMVVGKDELKKNCVDGYCSRLWKTHSGQGVSMQT